MDACACILFMCLCVYLRCLCVLRYVWCDVVWVGVFYMRFCLNDCAYVFLCNALYDVVCAGALCIAVFLYV